MKRHKLLIALGGMLALLGLLVFSGCCPLKYCKKGQKAGCQMHKKQYCPPDKECYTCPMHPEEMKMKPGKCSKCNMDLVPHKCGPTKKDGKKHMMKKDGMPHKNGQMKKKGMMKKDGMVK